MMGSSGLQAHLDAMEVASVTTPLTEYRIIVLTQGKVALVDKEDYERLNKHKWCARKSKSTGQFYAIRNVRLDGRHFTVYMHREILGIPPRDPRIGDHRNPSETLDNRKCNLRITDRSGNNSNRRIHKNSTSGYKGVTWHKRIGKWYAQISKHKKKIALGYFSSAHSAYEAYCEAAVRLHKDFARFK